MTVKYMSSVVEKPPSLYTIFDSTGVPEIALCN